MQATTNKVHIRWMVQQDIADVMEIEQLCFTDFPWPEDQLRRFLRDKYNMGFVAEFGESIVGYYLYEPCGKKLVIHNLAVHPSCWRRGVGRQIIDKLKAKLSPERRQALVCEVRESNVKAQIFFKALGFRCVGMIQSHYDDCVEDAYRFRFDCPVCSGECTGA